MTFKWQLSGGSDRNMFGTSRVFLTNITQNLWLVTFIMWTYFPFYMEHLAKVDMYTIYYRIYLKHDTMSLYRCLLQLHLQTPVLWTLWWEDSSTFQGLTKTRMFYCFCTWMYRTFSIFSKYILFFFKCMFINETYQLWLGVKVIILGRSTLFF